MIACSVAVARDVYGVGQVKVLTEKLDAAEREKTALEDKERLQSQQLEDLHKQLSSTTADKTTKEQKLTAAFTAATEQLDMLKRESESKMEALEVSRSAREIEGLASRGS